MWSNGSTMKERRDLPIGEIDERDSFFRISFGKDLSSLETSLALSGLLAPLILREKEGGYQVICGFRRLEALRHLGQERVWALIYSPEELPDQKGIVRAVAHNIPGGMNLVEKAQAVTKFKACGLMEEEIVSQWLPVLGLQPHKRVYAKLLRIADLPEGIKAYIVEQGLSLSTASLFPLFREEELSALAPLISSLRPGENKTKEILTHLHEIALREGTSVTALLEEARGLWAGDDGRAERLERFRDWLRRRRYPRFSPLKEEFEKFRASLRLPPSFSLHPPPFFEGEEFRVELRFSDREQLMELSQGFRRLLESLQGEEDPLRRFKGLP